MLIDDDRYEELMNAHRGLTGAQQQRLDAALILLLANQTADASALRRCIHDARVAVLTRENP